MFTRRQAISALYGAAHATTAITIPDRTTLQSVCVERGVVAIILGGFSELGDNGAGAIYIRGSSSGPMPIGDADGNWWNLSAPNEVWAGWFGMLGREDDTLAMQKAIDYVASQPAGGTVRIARGRYQIAHASKSALIGNEIIGDRLNKQFEFQSYCLRLPSRVAIVAERGTEFEGSYKFGSATQGDVVCFCSVDEPVVQNISIENVTFISYFIGIAIFRPSTVVLSSFIGNRFVNCAIGFYSRGLERCRFDWTIGQGTGALIVIGGHWSTFDDKYDEGGGFSDKTTFGTIHNIYARVFGQDEASIDQYFDEIIFRTQGGTLQAKKEGDYVPISNRFPYRGICGRAVYIMARHARPNNANTFALLTHAYAPRPALWIDAAIACVGQLVYLEGCGYRDNVRRIDPIGVTCIDPYLGAGVRVPAFVKGLACTIDAQFVVGRALNPNNTLKNNAFGCDLEIAE